MASDNPSVAIASTQYGAPIGEYHGSASNPIIVGIPGALLLIIGIFFLISRPPSGDTSGMVFASGFLIALALLSFGFMVWMIMRGRSAHAHLFEQGFVIARAGKTTTARWEDVASITQAITTVKSDVVERTMYVYTITLANGEKVRVDNTFKKIDKLGDSIQRMSANVLLPRALAAYQSGQSLPFGAISLSKAGVSNGKEAVPWSNIKQITTQSGALIVKRNDKQLAWVKTPVAKTPNFYIFMDLVGRIQRSAL